MMAHTVAKFPSQIWNGSTDNVSRHLETDNVDPNWQDYDRVVAEIKALETFCSVLRQNIVFTFATGSDATVANDVTPWLFVTKDCKPVKAFAIAKTAPVGSNLIIDLKVSTDNGSSWTSLWSVHTANRPTITDGTKSTTDETFDTVLITEGSVIRADVIQIGSGTAGKDITITLSVIPVLP